MDTLVEKCECFLEILQLSMSPRVEQLTKEQFSRAFQWAEYCQKLHDKIKGNTLASDQLNDKLKSLMINKCIHMGDFEFTFESLKEGPLLLYQNFLCNPHLPTEFLPLLLAERSKTNAHDGNVEDFLIDVVNIVQQRASAYFVESFNDAVTGITSKLEVIGSDCEKLGPDIKTAAQLMRKHIEMTITEATEKSSEFMISSFEATSSNSQCVTVILQSFIATSPELPLPVRESSEYYTCAVSWLRRRENIHREMAQLPRPLVQELVRNYLEVYRMYLESLVKSASSSVFETALDPSTSNEHKKLTCDHVRQRMMDLLNHSSEKVREVARATVNSAAGSFLKEILKHTNN